MLADYDHPIPLQSMPAPTSVCSLGTAGRARWHENDKDLEHAGHIEDIKEYLPESIPRLLARYTPYELLWEYFQGLGDE